MPNRFVVLDEPYIPEEQIAAGPSGIVYRGHDLSLARTVRLKVLLENHLSCPVDHPTMEAYAPYLLQVVHPHTAALLVLDVSGDEVTLISEFAEGVNGWAFVESQPLTARDAQTFLRQLLEALSVGEALHLPHGNVKPSNLIIDRQSSEGGELKLLDWGLSHCRSHQPHETLALRAPECLHGGVATAQSDLFSAGASILGLLLGRLPVAGLVEESLYTGWQHFDPAEFRRQRQDLDADWLSVLLQLVKLDPDQRPTSARHALDLLAKAEKVSALPAFGPEPDRPVPQPGISQHSGSSTREPEAPAGRRKSCLGSLIWPGFWVVVLLASVAAGLIMNRDDAWPRPLLQALDQIESTWLTCLELTKTAIKELK